MHYALFLLAQAQPTEAPWWYTIAPMVLIFVIFYFLLVFPVRKRQKELARLVDDLKRGDKVITNGGMYGEVAAVEGGTIHLKIADNVKIRVAKSAIAGLEGGPTAGRTS